VRFAAGSHLSQGVGVEASIRARLFGVRLLKLDAQVVILPVEPVGMGTSAGVMAMSGSVEDAERELDRAHRTLSVSRRQGSRR
jgi:hypothetical protein